MFIQNRKLRHILIATFGARYTQMFRDLLLYS